MAAKCLRLIFIVVPQRPNTPKLWILPPKFIPFMQLATSTPAQASLEPHTLVAISLKCGRAGKAID